MNPSSCVESLLVSAEEFLMPLRSGDGFKPDKFRQLCNALQMCAKEWKTADSIPKKAANLLVDLQTGIEAASYLYHNEQQEELMKAADTIGDLVRDCIS